MVTNGVPIVSARRLPSMLRGLPGMLGPERVTDLAKRAGSASGPPPDEHAQGALNPRATNLNVSSGCLPCCWWLEDVPGLDVLAAGAA